MSSGQQRRRPGARAFGGLEAPIPPFVATPSPGWRRTTIPPPGPSSRWRSTEMTTDNSPGGLSGLGELADARDRCAAALKGGAVAARQAQPRRVSLGRLDPEAARRGSGPPGAAPATGAASAVTPSAAGITGRCGDDGDPRRRARRSICAST
jgi:hypothetical protein